MPGKENLLEILEGKIQERINEITRQIEEEKARKQEFLEKVAVRILGQVTEKIAEFIKSDMSSKKILTGNTGKQPGSQGYTLQVANEAIDEVKLTIHEVQGIITLIYKLLGAEVASEDETEYIAGQRYNAREADYKTTIRHTTFIPGIELVETKEKKSLEKTLLLRILNRLG